MLSKMSQASESYRQLAGGPKSELDGVFASGEQPSVDALTGFELRGFNKPWFASLLGIQKFIKAFFTTDDGSRFGCNTPVEQNGLEGDWMAKPDDANPKRFGFFSVPAVDPSARKRHPHALLLDYGRGHNAWYQPSRLLRDYVVRVNPGSDELLIGKAYLALGPLHLPLGYFLLERHRPLATPPRLPGT